MKKIEKTRSKKIKKRTRDEEADRLAAMAMSAAGAQGIAGLGPDGLGGMGGAQPLAVTMNHGICIAVECDEHRIDRRIANGYCDTKTNNISDAITQAQNAQETNTPLSIAVLGNCADILRLNIHVLKDKTVRK